MDNYNYPLGADTPDAPWNQKDPEAVDVEVEVIETYTKTLTIPVTDYQSYEDYDDEMVDGKINTHPIIRFDFSDCDLVRDYKDEHYTIETLLQKCKEELIKYRNGFDKKSADYKHLDNIISETNGWIQQDIEVYEI